MANLTNQYGGWSNEPTMWAWGAINPIGTLVSKEKPSLTLKNRETDRILIINFLKKIKWINLEEVNIEEILDYIYR